MIVGTTTLIALLAALPAIQALPHTAIHQRRQDIKEQICLLEKQQCDADGAALDKAAGDNLQKFIQAPFAAPATKPVTQANGKFATNGKTFDSAEEAIVQSCQDQFDACDFFRKDPNFDAFGSPTEDQCKLQSDQCLAQQGGKGINFKNPVACKVNFEKCAGKPFDQVQAAVPKPEAPKAQAPATEAPATEAPEAGEGETAKEGAGVGAGAGAGRQAGAGQTGAGQTGAGQAGAGQTGAAAAAGGRQPGAGRRPGAGGRRPGGRQGGRGQKSAQGAQGGQTAAAPGQGARAGSQAQAGAGAAPGADAGAGATAEE